MPDEPESDQADEDQERAELLHDVQGIQVASAKVDDVVAHALRQ
jgi:hypothetical protein